MFKRLNVICAILFLLIACSETKAPVLKIGKSPDRKTMEISQETDTFTIYDNLVYILNNNHPFKGNVITRRIYKGKVYRDLIQRETTDINIEPNSKQISDIINLRNIARKHGTGNFMLLFITNDIVIAKKPFIIKMARRIAPSDIKPSDSVKPINPVKSVKELANPEKSKPIRKERPEISKPMTPTLSPSEMMNN